MVGDQFLAGSLGSCRQFVGCKIKRACFLARATRSQEHSTKESMSSEEENNSLEIRVSQQYQRKPAGHVEKNKTVSTVGCIEGQPRTRQRDGHLSRCL